MGKAARLTVPSSFIASAVTLAVSGHLFDAHNTVVRHSEELPKPQDGKALQGIRPIWPGQGKIAREKKWRLLSK